MGWAGKYPLQHVPNRDQEKLAIQVLGIQLEARTWCFAGQKSQHVCRKDCYNLQAAEQFLQAPISRSLLCSPTKITLQTA
jgi:hypothetical protein